MMAIKMSKIRNHRVNWLNYESKKNYTYNRLKNKINKYEWKTKHLTRCIALKTAKR